MAEGQVGDKIQFKTMQNGVAESEYLLENDTTQGFIMTLDISEDDVISYTQTTQLRVYGKPFSHTDTSTLVRVN